MSDASRNPELDALLGAYALDALDADERAEVDAYLAVNAAARGDADELRESAAALALTPIEDTSASPEVWDRIAASIEQTPRAFTPIGAARTHRRALTTTILAVAAAVAIVVLAGSLVAVANRGGGSKAGDLAAGFDHARRQQGAREISLAAPGGGATLARVVLLPDGTGFLENTGMRALPDGRTYQLWAAAGDPGHPTLISAGVLGADPHVTAFHTDPNVHGFGVTAEQAPGVVSSTQPMVAITNAA